MTFAPHEQFTIGFMDGSLWIKCPMWANDLHESVPSKRWDKSKKMWKVGLVRANVDAIKALAGTAGVVLTDKAKAAIAEFDKQMAQMGKRSSGFPAWYKFKTEPTPYQAEALSKLYGLKVGALFWSMQIGKSKEFIDLAAAHRMEGRIEGTLIMVKRTLRRNWITQFREHCPLPWSVHLPDTEKRRQFTAWLERDHDFKTLIVGWESLSEGRMYEIVNEYVEAMNGRLAVAGDESTFIAGDSIRTDRATEAAHRCAVRYILTGTPALGHPAEKLFYQFRFLDPNIIGIDDFYAFRNRYIIMGGYRREIAPGKKIATKVIGYKNMDELTRLIAPYISQVEKKNVMKDLPPKRYERRTVELSNEQRVIYDKIRKEGVVKVGDHPERVIQNVLELALRLHQVAGGYAVKAREIKRIKKDGTPSVRTIYDPVEIVPPNKNPKMIELCEFVEEWRGASQGMIWAVYMPEIQAIAGLMRKMGLRVAELHGKVPDEIRQSTVIEPFQRGDFDVIVGNASTGGMGYTMMNAEINCFYNNTERVIDRVQAEDRNWGKGQVKSPLVVDIAAERTVDMAIIAANEEKIDLADYIEHHIDKITQILDGEVDA